VQEEAETLYKVFDRADVDRDQMVQRNEFFALMNVSRVESSRVESRRVVRSVWRVHPLPSG
jgi:hypothetical protein